MKTVDRFSAQGDVEFCRVRALPKAAKAIVATDARHVVAHSESGHHHWCDAEGVSYYRDPGNAFVCYLRSEHAVDIVHARPHHTHETQRLTPGIWKITRQREYTPQGYRRVED